ncbi:uncharacterized protein LOC143869789 [Tasmannia lanceolata]|uniref:uncharacterized protein LOC143869789 n=1 Tax=Tasmannia lanceolata TaxID=3420 RepID=UPI004063F98F
MVASLMALRQEDGESLKAFVSRFNREALQVPNLDPSAATNALLAGAKSNEFQRTVARQNPHSLAYLMAGAEEYISVEEMLATLDTNRKRTSEEERNPTKQLLAAIKEEDFVRWPAKMLTKGNKGDKSKYYRFHSDHGHDTDECRHLKEEIELLIHRGYLKKYVEHDGDKKECRERSPQSRKSSQRPRSPLARHESPVPVSPLSQTQRSQPTRVINTIMGGPAAGGSSSTAGKAYARQVNAVHTSNKKLKVENEISFSDADLDNLILPHDDTLFITMLVANWELKKSLVDNGSSADILYYNAFKQMMIGVDRLKPANSDLIRFSGETVKVEGQIELPVLVGEPPRQAFTMVNFFVVRATSAYNAILGRPGQNLLRAVASAYHQKMMFITPSDVGEVKGDQPQSRECYTTTLKGKIASEMLPIELLDLKDGALAAVNQPAENLVSIPLFENDEERLIKIGSTLGDSIREELVQFLRKNADIFAWTLDDMPGIDPKVIVHKLSVDPTCKPIKQKRRHFAP